MASEKWVDMAMYIMRGMQTGVSKKRPREEGFQDANNDNLHLLAQCAIEYCAFFEDQTFMEAFYCPSIRYRPFNGRALCVCGKTVAITTKGVLRQHNCKYMMDHHPPYTIVHAP